MKELKFFICEHCKNIVEMVDDHGVPITCCGQKMTQLTPNTSDGATEKHVPVVESSGSTVTVKVGSVEHPMTEEHHIAWIAIQTSNGCQRRLLKTTDKPEATFALTDGEKLIAAYEYCNLHGLWKHEA